jgi:phasin family protein
MNMNATKEQFAAAGQANMETAMTLVKTAFSSAERLAALNLNMARTMLDNASADAKSLIETKSPEQLAALRVDQARAATEAAVAYSRSVYDIANEARGEVSKLVEGQFAEANKTLLAGLDQAAKNGPAGSDVAVAAVKSTLATATAAYDKLNEATRKLVEIAEANVSAATAAAVKASTAAVAGAAKGKK